MLEHEPRPPNYDELRKIHEEPLAPPNHDPNRQNYSELKAEHSSLERRREEVKPAQEPEQITLIEDSESKMAAYRKELQIELEAGRIDKHEQIRREKLYDQKLTMAIQSTPEGKAVVLPEPDRARTTQERLDEPRTTQETPGFVKKVIDYDRALIDPSYRREIDQQVRAERAFRLEQQERVNGPQRTTSGGRTL